jgi:hypothetical protein
MATLTSDAAKLEEKIESARKKNAAKSKELVKTHEKYLCDVGNLISYF